MSIESLPGEEWRPVADWPGYEVSSLGRVVSRRRPRPVLLKPWVTPKGYRFVKLSRSTYDAKPQAVHRLVAAAFLGPRPDGREVRHLDGDTANNARANLTYGTKAENERDKFTHGTDTRTVRTKLLCTSGHRRAPDGTCPTCAEALVAFRRLVSQS